MCDSLQHYGLQHARLLCPSPTPRACSNSCPLSQWCHPTISSSVVSFSSCLQLFPASESFQMSQLFASGGPSIGASASASVLPMNIQDWSLLGWNFRIDCFELCAIQGTLRSLLQHHSLKASILHHWAFFIVQLSHPCIYWKNYSFDYMDLCQQRWCLCFLICCLGLSLLFFQGASVF